MKTDIKKLEKAKEVFFSQLSTVQNQIQNKADFKLSVIDFEGEGLCVQNEENGTIAELERCVSEIQNNGILTRDFHNENII